MNADKLATELKSVIHRHVKEEQQISRLLRSIDRRAADPSIGLHKAVTSSIRDAARVFGTTRSCTLLSIDGAFYPFSANIDEFEFSTVFREIYKSENGGVSIRAFGPDIAIYFRIGESSFIVVAFGFPDDILNPDIVALLKQFSDQIFLLIEYKKYRETRELEARISDKLFSSKLRPSEAWATILDGLVDYVPDWCPGRGQSEITQLLLVRKNEGTLHLVAGDGADNQSEFVLIKNSVVGSAVLGSWDTPQIIDTDDSSYSELYKGYMKRVMRYELVVPVVYENDVVAVANFEGKSKAIYNSLFLEHCDEAARYIAPILNSLKYRFESMRAKEVGLMYVLNEMLLRMGEAFGHLVSQPFLTTKLAAGEIEYLIRNQPENLPGIKLELDKIFTNVIRIEEECSQFVSVLPNFLYSGPQNICEQITNRLQGIQKLAAGSSIDIIYRFKDCNHDAYGSRLFLEHIFNIVNNSFQKIQEQQTGGRGDVPGRIIVSTKLVRSKTPSGRNTGIDFIYITITDNGGGASEDALKRMGAPGFTTKVGGNGFGVSAAMEYFASIGGEMTFGNFRGGLRTIIKMRKYDPNLHGEPHREQSNSKEGNGGSL